MLDGETYFSCGSAIPSAGDRPSRWWNTRVGTFQVCRSAMKRASRRIAAKSRRVPGTGSKRSQRSGTGASLRRWPRAMLWS